MSETDKKVKRGGMEFIPLPAGRTEDDFKVAHGRRHPNQLSLSDALHATVDKMGRRCTATRRS